MFDHFGHFVRGVMNSHIDTCHGIVFTRHTFQIRCIKFSISNTHFLGTTSGFCGHGIGNVTCGDFGTHLCKRDGKTSHTTSTITYGLSTDITIVLNPIQNFLNGLIVTCTNIQLDGVDIITFRINFVPTVETFGIKVFTNFCFIIDRSGHVKCGGRTTCLKRCRCKGTCRTHHQGGKDDSRGLNLHLGIVIVLIVVVVVIWNNLFKFLH
mmetsp:Transcript_4477/g.5363  ORF Transcript_4477/g.5363 Transcript_4477/m.5363 type:complete len:209 (+) Transcript_4477:499-1125(+)